ncbi:MAG: HK97 family phage prohead protease [Candidatus Acidiferrales bacterium]
MSKVERRFFTTELRLDGGDGNGVIRGYAALHYNGNKKNQSVTLPGGFRERLAKGCFTRALAKGSDVKCMFNHDPNCILGRTSNGTMQVGCDDTGLHFNCQLGKQSYAQDLRESIRTGLVNQCSFGFLMDDDPDSEDWGYDNDEETGERYAVRTIKNIGELLDASPVTAPAYPATSCSARELWPDGEPEVVLRAVGGGRRPVVVDDLQHRIAKARLF